MSDFYKMTMPAVLFFLLYNYKDESADLHKIMFFKYDNNNSSFHICLIPHEWNE